MDFIKRIHVDVKSIPPTSEASPGASCHELDTGHELVVSSALTYRMWPFPKLGKHWVSTRPALPFVYLQFSLWSCSNSNEKVPDTLINVDLYQPHLIGNQLIAIILRQLIILADATASPILSYSPQAERLTRAFRRKEVSITAPERANHGGSTVRCPVWRLLLKLYFNRPTQPPPLEGLAKQAYKALFPSIMEAYRPLPDILLTWPHYLTHADGFVDCFLLMGKCSRHPECLQCAEAFIDPVTGERTTKTLLTRVDSHRSRRDLSNQARRRCILNRSPPRPPVGVPEPTWGAWPHTSDPEGCPNDLTDILTGEVKAYISQLMTKLSDSQSMTWAWHDMASQLEWPECSEDHTIDSYMNFMTEAGYADWSVGQAHTEI